MIDNVRDLVINKCDSENWDFHISIVIKYSRLLAERLDSDVEMAELGALMHDIGWIEDMKNDKDHEISGQPIAEKILRELDYPQETIDEIKHIIASHRGSAGPEPETITAEIVANADAMSHFDVVPWLIQIGLKKNDNDVMEAVDWTYNKIERDWNTKLTLPEARELTKKNTKQ